MKEFKTNDELIDYLISKGVIVKSRTSAIKKLERCTYYSIINSYKNNFKDKNNNYLPNVIFDEIYALYEFDKNLKLIMMQYVLEVEILIKSLMANCIAENYGLQDYLDIKNFDPSASSKTVNKLISIINDEINRSYGIHLAITHYKDNYGFIPPFVLTKILTFGVMSKYYGLLKLQDRQKIAKYFNIPENLLKQILRNLTSVRNISAHTDRLFCFREKSTLGFKQIDSSYKCPTNNVTNFYMIMRALEFLLTKRQYHSLTKVVDREIKKLDSKLNSISINNILKIMGFPNV